MEWSDCSAFFWACLQQGSNRIVCALNFRQSDNMDEHTLNDLLECSVCLERLDTSSKVLPCQHTFCRKCLEVSISKQQQQRYTHFLPIVWSSSSSSLLRAVLNAFQALPLLTIHLPRSRLKTCIDMFVHRSSSPVTMS